MATSNGPEFVRNLSVEERASLERRLCRKIDIRLLPMIVLMYIMNYLDRNNIASARVQGLQTDLSLTDSQYQTAVSILFVGYVLMQVPSNLFLNKMGKPSLYLPVVMSVWGAISTATAAARNFSDLLAIRFFLGLVEAAYFPGCLLFLSSWYTRKELGLRTAILFSGSLLSGAFSGLIAAGILNGMNGARGITAWYVLQASSSLIPFYNGFADTVPDIVSRRWLFIIEGVVTMFVCLGIMILNLQLITCRGVAIAAFFVLPDFPRTTTWLTEEERQLAIWRLQDDIGEDDWTGSQAQTFGQGLKLAIADIKVWILMFLLLCIVSSASVTNFFPSVVQTLGYSSTITLLLTAPPYILAVITTSINAWHADRTGERFLHITIPLCFTVFAFVLAAATTATTPRYVAIMFMVPGTYTGYVVVLAWISNTIPRPPSKRAASLALINAASNTSSIYASYMYYGAPRYVTAFSVNCVTALLGIVSTAVLRAMLVRSNERLDREEQSGEEQREGKAGTGEAARKGFRFRY